MAAQSSTDQLPSTDRDSTARPVADVTVVIPTHNRPALMRRALSSVIEQDYAGGIEVIVVFDRCEPEHSLEREDATRRVRVLSNTRTPGLAGSRNTGILAATADYVAFLDDDDFWLPTKLSRQLSALAREPDADFSTTAMTVDCQGNHTVRRVGASYVHHRDLIRSRMAMLHSSSFLARRAALTGRIGLVDESLPRSMAEDWDLLLRASQQRPIVHVDEPLVRVTWGGASYFAQQWATRNAAQLWLLAQHPLIAEDRRGAGRAYGNLAVGCAAQGQPGQAVRWALRALLCNWREPRVYLAGAVASRIVSWEWLLRKLNAHGHGL
jgi:glycosyltransferase involved in cell wall biosynthesis